MKRILAFGDSSTWGWNPRESTAYRAVRYGREIRWTGRLQSLLGGEFEIIEEGLCGRTTVYRDPIAPYRCGKDMIVPLLLTHQPLDLVIIMVGTNDLKTRFSVPPQDIALGAGVLLRMCQNTPEAFADRIPRILLAAPAPLATDGNRETEEGFAGGFEKSKRLGPLYEKTAAAGGSHFIDLGQWVSADPLDGIHLDEESHRIIAERMAEKIRGSVFYRA